MKKGFTLVEIMITVTIIAVLAVIAIPNLLRGRVNANDAVAKETLHAISIGAESYAVANMGNYPGNITSLTGATPAYLNSAYCDQTISGYVYTCTFSAGAYTVAATPSLVGQSGTTTYTVTTGGVLAP